VEQFRILKGVACGNHDHQRRRRQASCRAQAQAELVIRGTRRKNIKQLLHYIDVISSQDTKEALRAEEVGYAPLIFRGSGNSDTSKAMTTLAQRARAMLTAKA